MVKHQDITWKHQEKTDNRKMIMPITHQHYVPRFYLERWEKRVKNSKELNKKFLLYGERGNKLRIGEVKP